MILIRDNFLEGIFEAHVSEMLTIATDKCVTNELTAFPL